MPFGSAYCPPAICLQPGEGPVHSLLTLLWYSLEPLFCVTRLCLRAFLGKVLSLSLFFFSLSLAIPQFGLLSHISSLRLSSGHSGLVPTLSRQPALPCPAPVHCWRTQVSRLPLCWKSQLGTLSVGSFFFPLLVLLPSKIPKLLTYPPVRGFPGVWKLLLLHDSLPGMGLCP